MKVREIKIEAKERFAINRYHAMLVYGVVYVLLLNIAILTNFTIITKFLWWYAIILLLLLFLSFAPFQFGMTDFYLRSYRCEKVDVFHVFDGFNKYNLERVVVLKLIKTALTILFTLLLIVPGIIYSIRTSMAVYLLRANPKMKAWQALKSSNKIMKGHCWDYFVLSISFIGWFFLSIVLLGLGMIWLTPYYNLSKIVFYKRELQGDKLSYATDKPIVSDSEIAPVVSDEIILEDDDKNVATQLIKFQLAQEIETLDKKLDVISKERTLPKERVIAKPIDNIPVVKNITAEIDSDAFISDEKNFDEEVKNVSNLILNDLSEVSEVPLPSISAQNQAHTRTIEAIKQNEKIKEAEKNAGKILIDKGAFEVTKEKTLPIIDRSKLDSHTQTNFGHNITIKDENKESIKMKIEQLKQERENRRQNLAKEHPLPLKPQIPIVVTPKNSSEKQHTQNASIQNQTSTIPYTKPIEDDFMPQKIDIEILEDK